MRQGIGWAKRLVPCLLATLLTSTALPVGSALAAEADVEALIQRGIELRRASADDEALTVFLEAEKREPSSVRVLLHIVTAAQAAGKWLVADTYMKKVSALSDDPYYRRHADAINVVRRAVAARVGTFDVQGGPDGASVRLDGQLVDTLPMKEPAPIEAGTYLMEVDKPGYYRLRRNVTITGGVLTREPVELNRALARSDSEGLAGANTTSDERSWWQAPAFGWTLVGLGVASGVASGLAFASREQNADEWNDESQCISSNGSTREQSCGAVKKDVETAETVGIVTGIAGALFATAGIIQLVAVDHGSAHEAPEQAAEGLHLTGCGAGFLSLSCKGSF